MASLTKTYSAEKLFGQVYTPNFVVDKILDDIHYHSEKILGKPILDPACGDGQFLVQIVKRIIKFSPRADLRQNLECVYGWDIDAIAIYECLQTLNKLIEPLAITVDWRIEVTDALKKYRQPDLFNREEWATKFTYIVGNPPYIRIQHLAVEQRQYIQQNYTFCQNGSTDIYLAFYELCLHLLADNGFCGLITPNSFLSTETARKLRQYFVASKNLVQITNYGEIQLFAGATTYCAMMIFNKRKNQTVTYQKAITATTFFEKKIRINSLQEPFWQFPLDENTSSDGIKLKDICEIHVGITTLCDRAYIFPICAIDDDYVIAETKLKGAVKLERAILKPIIKGSKLKNAQQPISEYVLFPYYKNHGKNIIIPESVLAEKYPLAYNYLLSVKSELDKRDNGACNPVIWYAFGRSQGLDTSFGEKIIFSPMNLQPNFVHYKNPECTFYSGYCLKYKGDIAKLLPQLNSDKMAKFIAASSRDFRGGWKAYNKKIIENFTVTL